MGKLDSIAILTDLDNTFFGTGAVPVPRNLRAIERFKAEGGLFSLSTGRMHYNLDRAVPGVREIVNAPAILCNGTYLYDFASGHVLSEITMDGEVAYRAVAFIKRRFPDSHIRVSFRGGYLLEEGDLTSISEIVGYGIDARTVLPFSEWRKDGWYKFVCTDHSENLREIRAALEAEFPGVFEYNRSSDHLLEMQMKGTSKASMLGAFREYYRRQGRTLKIYVCGDFENDATILRAADVAVCPSNALDSIREISDYCLCSNDDGVIADLVELLEKAE